MSLFRRKETDKASVLSQKLYDQRRQLASLRIAESNLDYDGYDRHSLELVKQQIARLELEFEINQHKLAIVLKQREIKALP